MHCVHGGYDSSYACKFCQIRCFYLSSFYKYPVKGHTSCLRGLPPFLRGNWWWKWWHLAPSLERLWRTYQPQPIRKREVKLSALPCAFKSIKKDYRPLNKQRCIGNNRFGLPYRCLSSNLKGSAETIFPYGPNLHPSLLWATYILTRRVNHPFGLKAGVPLNVPLATAFTSPGLSAVDQRFTVG